MKICRVEKKREVVDIDYEVCNEYCCDMMKRWLNISKYSNRHTMWYNVKAERFILEVRTAYDGYRTSDGTDSSAYEDLNFCPFCGTKLQEQKIIEVKTKVKRIFKR